MKDKVWVRIKSDNTIREEGYVDGYLIDKYGTTYACVVLVDCIIVETLHNLIVIPSKSIDSGPK